MCLGENGQFDAAKIFAVDVVNKIVQVCGASEVEVHPGIEEEDNTVEKKMGSDGIE